MLLKTSYRVGLMALLLMSTGCSWWRDRCCNRPATLLSRFRPTPAYTIESGPSCDTSGPMLGNPGVILPDPKPIPRIQENPGQQKEYNPGMGTKNSKTGNDLKTLREGI